MNNVRYFLFAAFLGAAGTVMAQDAYDAHNFTNSDLNGTARYVSMGGALGALGADLSTMSSNPAGTALYRRDDFAISLGGQFTGDGAMGHDGSRMSLDQLGAVFVLDMDGIGSGVKNINFGLNYQKNRNFLGNSKIDVRNIAGHNISQTNQIAYLANIAMGDAVASGAKWYEFMGLMPLMATDDRGTILYDIIDANGDPIMDQYGNPLYSGMGAQKAYHEKATYGSNGVYDVNLSVNSSDRYFFGVSFGIYDMDYSRESLYEETDIYNNKYRFQNWYKTDGSGFDVKLGFICRPIEDSPFRFGVTVHTPTWYQMTDINGASLYNNGSYVCSSRDYEDFGYGYEFDYKFRTPWKFGVSLGHTIGNSIALGAEYEYQDFSTARYSEIDGYDGIDSYFYNVNKDVEKTLKGQHTLKLGGEYRPIDNVAFRLGYNYVSSPFQKDSYKAMDYDSYSTETDYTNWSDINRFTLGVGFKFKGGYFDIAYQYQMQKGDFYAFNAYEIDGDGTTNLVPNYTPVPTSIKNNRSQLMATLGFRF